MKKPIAPTTYLKDSESLQKLRQGIALIRDAGDELKVHDNQIVTILAHVLLSEVSGMNQVQEYLRSALR